MCRFPRFFYQFKPDVVLANWTIVHRLWHNSLEEFGGFLKSLGNELDNLAASGGHIPRYAAVQASAWRLCNRVFFFFFVNHLVV